MKGQLNIAVLIVGIILWTMPNPAPGSEEEMNCMYCGKAKVSLKSLDTHQMACPEMRFFANLALNHSDVLNGKAFLGGVETSSPRVVAIVQNFKKSKGMRDVFEASLD